MGCTCSHSYLPLTHISPFPNHLSAMHPTAPRSDSPVNYYDHDDTIISNQYGSNDEDDAHQYLCEGDPYPQECYFESYDIKMKERVCDTIRFDDVSGFVFELKSLFNFHGFDDPTRLCPKFVLFWICNNNASKCATALLHGLTCVSCVDLNISFSDGRSPLHIVAFNYNTYLVNLFLSYGAQADVTNKTTMESNSRLLNVVLERLNNHLYLYYWTPEESIYKLVIILCLPQMKVVLDTIRLLASNSKDIMEVFVGYAKEGRLIEMAVLLLVASDRISLPDQFRDEEGFIMKPVDTTFEDIIIDDMLMQARKHMKVCQQSNDEKRNALDVFKAKRQGFSLMLMKILGTTVDAIKLYLQSQHRLEPKEQVAKKVASILEESSFELNEKDIDLSNVESDNTYIQHITGTSDDSKDPHFYHLMFTNDVAPEIKYCNVKLQVIEQNKLEVEGMESSLKSDDDIHEHASTIAFKQQIDYNFPSFPALFDKKIRITQEQNKLEFEDIESSLKSNYIQEHAPTFAFNQHIGYKFPRSIALIDKKFYSTQIRPMERMLHYIPDSSRLFNSFGVQKHQFKGENNVIHPLIRPLRNQVATFALALKRRLK